MSRISQQVAHQIAKKLVVKKRELQSKAGQEFKEHCTKLAEEKVPKDVMAFFKKHSEYLKTTSSIRVDGKGISNLGVLLVRAIPSVSPNCYYNHIDLSDTEVAVVKKMNDAYEKLEQNNDDLEKEIERTLITLRTYANIQKELPEAAEYLPQVGLTVIVDTDSLRKKLK